MPKLDKFSLLVPETARRHCIA